MTASLCYYLRLRFLRPKSAIYVVNESTVVTETAVRDWCKAVQKQIRDDVAPAWGKKAKTVRFVTSPTRAPHNAWIVVVLNDADQAGALGYHSTDSRGRVYARVFAKTAQDYGYSASVTFSHEVLETWGDPGVDKAVQNPNAVWAAPLELCDAVEGDSYQVDGVDVSNFLLPAWFGLTNGDDRNRSWYDHLDTAPGPFKCAPRGYMVRQFPDGSNDQVFGRRYDKSYGEAKTHPLGRGKRRRG